jgi:poly-gamma-glutamate synthesis protein (capsule biosynthesis protein)
VDRASARGAYFGRAGNVDVAFLAYTAVYQPGWDATDSRAGMAIVNVHTSYEPRHRFLEQPGTSPIVRTFVDRESLVEIQADVQAARSAADIVVVSFHWGVSEGRNEVLEYQTELARRCIDVGATIVFGHHPHVLTPMEIYKGRPIFYSLGNMVFDLDAPFEFMDAGTVLVDCTVANGDVPSIDIIGINKDSAGNLVVASGEAARSLAARVAPQGSNGPSTDWNGSRLSINLSS